MAISESGALPDNHPRQRFGEIGRLDGVGANSRREWSAPNPNPNLIPKSVEFRHHCRRFSGKIGQALPAFAQAPFLAA